MLATRLNPSLRHHRSTLGHRICFALFASLSRHPASHATRTCHTDPRCKYLEDMFKGNQEYRKIMSRDYPGLLTRLAELQSPPFFMLTCPDSRVSEQDIFNAKLGTMFTASNIANQFDQDDAATASVLAFSVGTLKVKHVLVMGHYGCAGVAAAMVSPPAPPLGPGVSVIQEWISPIRRVLAASERPELVAYRQHLATYPDSPEPEPHNPAFRALVEENVKASVKRIENSEFMRKFKHFVDFADTATVEPIFIHGWVYDMHDGLVYDLNVSAGPPGMPIPIPPLPAVRERPA